MLEPSAGKLLLIAHEGSRSGAPMLLLTFARWLKANTDVQFEVLLLRDGPLRGNFAAIAPTWVAEELGRKGSFVSKLERRLFKARSSKWQDRAFAKLANGRFKTVFGNSIVCLPWLARFKAATDARCVCAVHELGWAIERFHTTDYVARTLPQMDRVVAGSRAVGNNLTASFAIPSNLIDVVHSFVEDNLSIRQDNETLRRALGVGLDDFVIGGVGGPELRKGLDLIAPIARALMARNPQRAIKFVWLGGKQGDELVSICRRDAERLGLADNVMFVEPSPDANDYINACDVFALPSREDPFPLVVLSAIRLGKPVVAFARSGGMDELLSDGAGCLVPYLDLERFAEALEFLLLNPEAGAKIVRTAQTRVLESYGVDRLAKRLYDSITGASADGAAIGS